MRTSLTATALLVALTLTSGCVSEGKYRDLEEAYRASQEQVVSLQSQIEELKNRIKLLAANPSNDPAKIAELEKLNNELQAKLDEWARKYNELAASNPQVIKLDPGLDQALRDFAAQHPDIVEYDPTLGMVKFKADVTFKLGSSDLSDNARQTLGQLAGILNSAAAQKYEVRVVGHTDNVRIVRPSTLAKHPDNWYLSAHRAISVRQELQSDGVPPVRTSVAGYGQYRPIVANGRLGAEKNRRVEIYLVPMAPVNPGLVSDDAAPAPRHLKSKPAPAPASGGANASDIPLK